MAAQGAFAFENLLQIKAHGASLINCRSNFPQALSCGWNFRVFRGFRGRGRERERGGVKKTRYAVFS